ncbi:MAG: LamG domain protein jellyroll fold domain protein, partial [Rhizobacter sp.]|nr:LamG domain protein jellyroll fold domain protein [Rhizobacter sp.]
ATTPTTAAAAITASVYQLGRLGVISYGCPLWAMEMYARSFAPWNHFDCTAWLERLAGGLGNGPYVNCTDCATIVSTFANALGCDLWQSRMGRYSPQFATFPILAIGTLQWQIPCGVWPAFSFHEVAWTGRCSDDDLVFDACLLLDADLMPWFAPRQARLPVAARFGRPGEGGYRDQLATPLGRFDCVARSQERRRRLVF